MSHRTLVAIPSGPAAIEGILDVPDAPLGIVLFAHGSGSSRHSPRNNYVAAVLREARIGTLLLDLLSPAEDRRSENRFDIGLLVDRLQLAAHWLQAQPLSASLKLGLFGASTGAAAALQLAARGDPVAAVVSRGGRPDLAGRAALAQVTTPTLLIVGGDDHVVIDLNRKAFAELGGVKELVIVPGATHLFEEPGTLEEVARLATGWFTRYLQPATT
jgi:putative phosphoribosyl transferase